MAEDSNGGWGLEDLADELTELIGKRVVGVALAGSTLEIVFDDCTTLALHAGGSQTELAIDRLGSGECRCLKQCLEKHDIGSLDIQDCMDSCVESSWEA